jgi:hypothetical protein
VVLVTLCAIESLKRCLPKSFIGRKVQGDSDRLTHWPPARGLCTEKLGQDGKDFAVNSNSHVTKFIKDTTRGWHDRQMTQVSVILMELAHCVCQSFKIIVFLGRARANC